MTTVAMGSRSDLGTHLMKRLHDFRHEVFVRRLNWSLPQIDGVEHDQYDTAETMYVTIDDGDRVSACARLIPTTGSYMLPELFPQLLGDVPAPHDPAIWELSRFATNVRETKEGRALAFSPATLNLWEQVFAYARRHGVKRLVAVTSIAIERILLRSGFEAHRVAPPARVDGALTVALYVEVPQSNATSADA